MEGKGGDGGADPPSLPPHLAAPCLFWGRTGRSFLLRCLACAILTVGRLMCLRCNKVMRVDMKHNAHGQRATRSKLTYGSGSTCDGSVNEDPEDADGILALFCLTLSVCSLNMSTVHTTPRWQKDFLERYRSRESTGCQ